jgi:dTDP-4-amino-4,6-dideoxygalactose transaminase
VVLENIMNDQIYVARPSLPPLEEFTPYLEEIWKNKTLTNNGPFHQELERELCKFLGVQYISLFTNGTIALITALQALDLKGEVITTPYSFVATCNALLWNRLTPVFVDIEEKSFNIDPSKIEKAITKNTVAILPVHVYGVPCNVEEIEAIAKKHNLKVIYDAAHAFGVSCCCGSIFQHGDASVLSFHATKVFNTFEGGAVVCRDPHLKRHIDRLKNFGFVDETTVISPGGNGKMTEVCAAFGLVQLRYIESWVRQRGALAARYCELLGRIEGIQFADFTKALKPNYSYFPLLVNDNFPLSRDELFEQLHSAGILARRYFFPLISEFPMYRDLKSADPKLLPIATKVSESVICLPVYPALSTSEQDRVVDVIRQSSK